MSDLLTQLKELDAKRTKGPWWPMGNSIWRATECPLHAHVVWAGSPTPANAAADVAFIAATANALPALIEAVEALSDVHKLVTEAALTGFNCHDGDWATRLFESQQRTSAALKALEQDNG